MYIYTMLCLTYILTHDYLTILPLLPPSSSHPQKHAVAAAAAPVVDLGISPSACRAGTYRHVSTFRPIQGCLARQAAAKRDTRRFS